MESSAFSSIDEWKGATEIHNQASAILFNIGWRNANDLDVMESVKFLASNFGYSNDRDRRCGRDDSCHEDTGIWCARLHSHQRGLDVAIEAVRLARAEGSLFRPAASLPSSNICRGRNRLRTA